jgi:glycosyltransferase involved in cell wall biosynthesis
LESTVLVGEQHDPASDVVTWYRKNRLDVAAERWGERLGLSYVFSPRGFGLPFHRSVRQADVLHLHNLHGGYINYLSVALLARTRPALLTVHDDWALTGHCAVTRDCGRWMQGCGTCPHLDTYPAVLADRTAAAWKLKAFALGRAPLTLVAPSRSVADKIGRSYLQHRPLELIPHGIDTALYRPVPRDDVRKALGIPPKAVVLLVVANDLRNPLKGIVPLVQQLAALPAELRRSMLLLSFGAGGEYLQSIAPLASRSLGVLHSEEARRDAYAAADLYVTPSHGEAFGLSALEAAACGTPVIAYDVGGLRDIVQPGISGVRVTEGREDEMVRAIADLAANVGARMRLGAGARALALERFSESDMVARYVRLYESLCALRAR